MDISLYGLLIVVFGAVSLALPFQWAIYGMAVCSLFGSTAAIAFPAVGGFTILPANLFLLFFVIRALFSDTAPMLLRSVAPGQPGFWLLCMTLYAVFGAIVLPRVFSGETLVFSIDRSDTSSVTAVLQPLKPVSGNLSQPVYLLGELGAYASMLVFLRKRDGSRLFANAILVLAALNLGAGVLDLVSYGAGIDVLSVVKTADYAMHDMEELGGLKRITGTFSEASAFSSFTLPLFAFTVNLWLLGYRRRLSGVLALGCVVFLLVSTSATAYTGLAAYLIVFFASRSGALAAYSRSRKVVLLVSVLCAIAAGGFLLVAFDSPLLNIGSDFLGETLLEKMSSDSGMERAIWNMQAIVNFTETAGFGVGLGSARASSFALVLLSNLGVLGSLCFGLFCYKSWSAPIRTLGTIGERVVCYSARQAMLAAVITASASASVFDLGPCFYLFAAASAVIGFRPGFKPNRVRSTVASGAAAHKAGMTA